jgi:dienelactone hydrolase
MKLSLLFLWPALVLPAAGAPLIVTPKPGVEVPREIRVRMEREIAALSRQADALRERFRSEPDRLRFLPDAEVLHEGVRRTLEDGIFFKAREWEQAEKLLAAGRRRLGALERGEAPWNDERGLVIRGYRSKIDGSLQPLVVQVPVEWKRDGNRRRLDIWYHGRNDRLSEVAFMAGQSAKPGPFSPSNGFVLYPYGRFCNAMKFAGETDTFEGLDRLREFYAIDDNRIAVRGFSMGGAASWHMGAHHAWRWVAVNPGAGFVETELYQGLTGKLNAFPEFERRLWNLTDALNCAVNLENTTLVAYSGEEDKQKAAADLMEAALKREGIAMTHIIGPKTGHKYEPKARETVAGLVDAASARGRNLSPARIRFVTYTLKYNRMHWVRIDALKSHWTEARVEAEMIQGEIRVNTRNVAAITLDPIHITGRPKVVLDGQILPTPPGTPLAGWQASYEWTDGEWRAARPAGTGLRKEHGLQGPIDDAFMDSFVFVAPDGKAWHPGVDRWVRAEMEDAVFQWRRQMRGEARVKTVAEINAADIEQSHLVLWGDPAANSLLDRVLGGLPVKWNRDVLEMAGERHDPSRTVIAMVFPNPLNPKRYVVLNSGMTYAHHGAQSNSMQTPKLPDWAVLDTAVTAPSRMQGKGVSAAGFFDEHWRP